MDPLIDVHCTHQYEGWDDGNGYILAPYFLAPNMRTGNNEVMQFDNTGYSGDRCNHNTIDRWDS